MSENTVWIVLEASYLCIKWLINKWFYNIVNNKTNELFWSIIANHLNFGQHALSRTKSKWTDE